MLRIRLSTNEDMVPIGPARRRQEFVSPGPSHQPVLTLAAGVRVDSLAGMAVSGWRSSHEWRTPALRLVGCGRQEWPTSARSALEPGYSMDELLPWNYMLIEPRGRLRLY